MTQPVEGPEAIRAALVRIGLIGADEPAHFTALAGGVSSDIWRIDLASGAICAKRALAKLKVEADWRAPVERNRYEAAWIARANAIVPGMAPALLGEDRESGTLVMAYLAPEDHPVWKAELAAGRADPAFAAEVGRRVAAVHAATAGDAEVRDGFPTDAIFHAIRLEPYLLATARAHPDLARRLEALARRTAENRRALVHGDVSPKNILVGPGGPVLLDAECAWYGDPAFDLAFCLNHLLLKCLWRPEAQERFLACFAALAEAYLAGVDWEPPAEIEARVASLLPGLFLARVDGKSPVEYLTAKRDKEAVRAVARPLIADPPDRLAEIAARWATAIREGAS